MKRWEATLAAVESVVNQDNQPLEIILVIDYNEELFNRFRDYYDGHSLVHVFANTEPQGLSGARNMGIQSSKGYLIGFLDDDAIAEVNWLSRLTYLCEQNNILGAGGHVLPLWEDFEAKWFPEEFYWVIGCSYKGLPKTISEVRNPFGGCMVIARYGFDGVGGFHVGTGRIGDIPLGCEETELCIRARQAWPQIRFLYDPDAKIQHRIPGNRLTLSYFFSRCYNEGISKAQLSFLVGARDSLSSEKSYVLQTLSKGVLRGLLDTFKLDFLGLGRSLAIISGLIVTGIGYIFGQLQFIWQRKDFKNSSKT